MAEYLPATPLNDDDSDLLPTQSSSLFGLRELSDAAKTLALIQCQTVAVSEWLRNGGGEYLTADQRVSSGIIFKHRVRVTTNVRTG